MKGLGTIVNVAAVALASLLGLLFKGGIKEKYQNMVKTALGVATIFIGAAGTLAEMLQIGENGKLSTQGSMLLFISLVVGGLLGELLAIEDKLESVGVWLKKKVKAEGDNRFVDGFVDATLVICIGAMAIMGSLQDGLTGSHETLFIKSSLDFFFITILSSTMGIGTLFSIIPLGIYQGLITLGAGLIAPYMSDTLISNLSLVGSVLIFCIGVNFIAGKKFKVGNLLPALLGPVVHEIAINLMR
ncbi:MAG: DUF554 domain-containing protein [Clostridia bacterium]|nr:DUF554 domain-containing protein [Clostridia bacterium]